MPVELVDVATDNVGNRAPAAFKAIGSQRPGDGPDMVVEAPLREQRHRKHEFDGPTQDEVRGQPHDRPTGHRGKPHHQCDDQRAEHDPGGEGLFVAVKRAVEITDQPAHDAHGMQHRLKQK